MAAELDPDALGERKTPDPRAERFCVKREVAAGYFLLRRWWRVLRSSLRCFFFAIRLRRFLITEPILTSLILERKTGSVQNRGKLPREILLLSARTLVRVRRRRHRA